MRVSRRHGLVRLRFDEVEARLLASLLEQFVARLGDEEADTDDPVERRLFPQAYDDADAAAEFRQLTESGLRDERARRAQACAAELALGELELQPDDSERWIQVLNDLRLVLGTRLGVTEDDDHSVDPDDPEAGARSAYYWLSYLQESMVRALMR